MKANFNVLSQPCAKLCLFKVAKSDARIRLLFTNPVTYNDNHRGNFRVKAMVVTLLQN